MGVVAPGKKTIMRQISIFVEFVPMEAMKAYEGSGGTCTHTVIQGTYRK